MYLRFFIPQPIKDITVSLYLPFICTPEELLGEDHVD